MARSFTGEELLTVIRRKAGIPKVSTVTAPQTGSLGTEDSDLLEMVHEVLLEEMLGYVVELKEDFFVRRQSVAVNDDKLYRVPHRAIGGKLRDLYWVSSQGKREKIHKIDRNELHYYNDAPEEVALGHYYDGVYYRTIGAGSGTIEEHFYMRPGELVLSTAARQITAVNQSIGSVTVATSPTSWGTSDLFDIHSNKSGAEIKYWDLDPTSDPGGATTISMGETLDGSTNGRFPVEVGDWLCLAEEAALPALPVELHPVLAQAAVVAACGSLGDMAAVESHIKRLNRMLKRFKTMLRERTEGSPQKVVPRSNTYRAWGRRGMGIWS